MSSIKEHIHAISLDVVLAARVDSFTNLSTNLSLSLPMSKQNMHTVTRRHLIPLENLIVKFREFTIFQLLLDHTREIAGI